MNEPLKHDAVPSRVARDSKAPAGRKPFERPAVQALGQLTLLTLVTGGGGI